MSMDFTVTVRGNLTAQDIDVSDAGLDADDVLASATGWGSSVEYEDAEIYEGTVTIKAVAVLHDVEVPASGIRDFDGEQELESAIDLFAISLSNVEFEIDESPTGFDAVESAIGRTEAIEAYAALALAGFEVS